MSVFELPKHLHPDFQKPRVKPVGSVEIDASNKYAGSIRFAYAPQVIDRYSDRVSKDIAGVISPNLLSFSPQIQSFNNDASAGGSKGSLLFNQTTSGDVAIVTRFRNRATVAFSQGRFIDTKTAYDGADGFHIGFDGSNIGIRGSGATEYSPAYTNTEFVDLIITLEGTTATLYVNRELVGSGTIGAVSSVETQIIIGHNLGNNEYGFLGDIEYLYLADPSNVELLLKLQENPYQILKPKTPQVYFTVDAGGTTSTLTGTITASVTESDIVTGGKTLIITITGDTWKAAGTGPIGSTADTQALIDGFSAASSPTNGWNNEVRDKALTSEVVRTSDTVATWTVAAQSGYDITAQEVITGTIPVAALTTGAGTIVSTPTFTIDPVSGFQTAWARNSNTVIQVGM